MARKTSGEATFRGTFDDYHFHVGPSIRNKVQSMTKAQRNGKCANEYCSNTGTLDAAHKSGRSRRDIIEEILGEYLINGSNIVECNLNEVAKRVENAHRSFDQVFDFICKPCHKKQHADERLKNKAQDHRHVPAVRQAAASLSSDLQGLASFGHPLSRDNAKLASEAGVRATSEPSPIDLKKAEVVNRMAGFLDVTFSPESNRESNSLYRSIKRDSLRIACAVSKRYERKAYRYFYSYHATWRSFLQEGARGFVVLGCLDSDHIFSIPFEVMERVKDALNVTPNPKRHPYWYVHLVEKAGGLSLYLPKQGSFLDLEPYKITTANL